MHIFKSRGTTQYETISKVEIPALGGIKKSIFGNVANHDNYKFTRMIEYVEDLKLDLDDAEMKFDENLKSDYLYIPIDPLSSFWADIEEIIDEDIFTHCDELAGDLKKDLEKASSKKEKEDLNRLISFWENDMRKALEKCHQEFNKQLDKEYEKINKARKKVLTYMSTNQRLEKKQSHWPLELLEI